MTWSDNFKFNPNSVNKYFPKIISYLPLAQPSTWHFHVMKFVVINARRLLWSIYVPHVQCRSATVKICRVATWVYWNQLLLIYVLLHLLVSPIMIHIHLPIFLWNKVQTKTWQPEISPNPVFCSSLYPFNALVQNLLRGIGLLYETFWL